MRLKARLVAQEFLQTFGLDFFDTYAPVAQMTSFHATYALFVNLTLFIKSMEVEAAFHNDTLIENVYIDPLGYPPGVKRLGTETYQGTVWVEAVFKGRE